MRRLINLFTAIAVAVGLFCYPSFVKAEDEIKPLEILRGLKIIRDAEIFEDTPISRADALSWIMNLRGTESYSPSGIKKFKDISVYDDNYALIDTALSMGIISGYGDGYFRPLEQLSLDEAVVMTLNMMGYRAWALGMGGGFSAYYTLAARVNLLAGVNTKDSYLSNGGFARMLYNTFDIGIIEQTVIGAEGRYEISNEKSSLSYLKLKKGIGILTDNEVSSIYTSSKDAARGRVCIGDVFYNIGDTNAGEYLGYNVEFYYTEGEADIERIVYIFPKRNDVLSLSLSNEFYLKGETLYYSDDNDREIRIDIGKSGCMLLNGEAVEFDFSHLTGAGNSGTVTFINNGSGEFKTKYGIMLIESYINDTVANASMEEGLIYLNYTKVKGLPYIDLFSNDISYTIYKNGGLAGLSDIVYGDVISYAASPSGINVNIKISSKIETGTIQEYDEARDGKVTISGNAYPLAQDIKNKDRISLSQNVTLYINSFNQVIGCKTDSVKNYAFVLKTGKSNDLDSAGLVKLYTLDGVKTFRLAKRVTRNTEYTYTDVDEALADLSGGKADDDLIVYSVNKNNEIDNIDFWEPQSSNILSDQSRFIKSHEIPSTASAVYNGRTLGGIGIMNTRVFFIPPGDDVDENECVVSSFAGGVAYKSVKLYDINPGGVAKAALIRDTSRTFANTPSNLCMVKKITESLDRHGALKSKLYYQLDGTEGSVFIAENPIDVIYTGISQNIHNAKLGDIFAYEANMSGELYKYSFYYVHSLNKNLDKFIYYGGTGTDKSREVQLAAGTLLYKDDILATLLINDEGNISFEPFSDYQTAGVYIVDLKNQSIRKTSFDSLYTHNFSTGELGQRLLVRGRRYTMREVFIYEE